MQSLNLNLLNSGDLIGILMKNLKKLEEMPIELYENIDDLLLIAIKKLYK